MISVPTCVLIVDDHVAVRKALRSLFDLNGFTVCGEAVNGQDAVEKAQRLHPDLIVLDLSMPVMDGFEAARELANLLPELPLIILTNDAGAIGEEDARKLGIRRVLSKREPVQQLIDEVRELVATKL